MPGLAYYSQPTRPPYGDNALIKQENRYELINHHFEYFPKEYLDKLGGNYTYTIE
ncbi:hypothetical protein [Cellvibrio sp. UBA7671]|uniref:hypothetical protein n=1 Tax=Cellvibrio sp. UBA7671 TaxID=1946312 RepID=UPI002F3506FD